MPAMPDGNAALTALEERMLVFERSWWSHDADRETAIRDEFALSPAEFHHRLGELIDRPAALAFDPPLVRRLRRLRSTRQRARSERRSGPRP
jgi:hypothetical protein